MVCLVADRDLSGTGTEVTFLGGPARLPSGPAGSPGSPVPRCTRPTYFTDDAWGVEVGAPVLPVPTPSSASPTPSAT
ncbi:hypothetical protein [Pseudonocardia sp. ICBG601]|uniref:hypothetical protein n=1 Tax=Pseudonocardia sp. ICBG601 TaxID=2846759 RepID=UPI001CF6DE6D|nr:hypothetical protein [Pseudonocardia sp. ICBG601]